LARAAVLLAQLEIPIETVVHAARLAKRASLMFVLDAAPATRIPQELIALADVVTANSEEAHVLSGVDVGDRPSAIRLDSGLERIQAPPPPDRRATSATFLTVRQNLMLTAHTLDRAPASCHGGTPLFRSTSGPGAAYPSAACALYQNR
jgi:sugar/nucleoside kinase (ribokinase family)